MLDSKRKRILGKNNVLKHAQDYFSSIANNEDDEARPFLDEVDVDTGLSRRESLKQ